MTGDNPWVHLGGEFLTWVAASETLALPVDAIEYAGMLLLINVLYGMKQFTWLHRAVNILRDREAFLEHVKPQCTPVMTSNSSVTKELRNLSAMDRAVLKKASKYRKAWGRFFIVPKYDGGLPTGKGRTIFDLSVFSRLCARPFPVNLPHIPILLQRIGSYRFEESFMWTSDWKNFFHLVPIGEHMSDYFTIKVGLSEAYQAIVLPQGWSWSPCLATALSYGIILGNWPSHLKYLIDWESLKGDTSPAFIPLHDKDGTEIGLITVYIDNIFLITNNKKITDEIRAHVINRAKFCRCAFKVKEGYPKDPETGDLLPDLPTTSGVFLGVRLWFEGNRWTWTHANPETISCVVPGHAPRRKFSSIVGFLNWDNMISLEGLQCMQPIFQIIRRLTKGVHEKKQWSEIVEISETEKATLEAALNRARTRERCGIDDAERAPTEYVFVATDASKYKTAWVELPTQKVTPADLDRLKASFVGTLWDVAPADHTWHIFYKELEAAVWAVQVMSIRYPGKLIVLATDNSAVYYLLLRGFTGVEAAIPMLDALKHHLAESGCKLLPVMISGLQQIADCPTRDAPFEWSRLEATWCHLNATVSGGGRRMHEWGSKRPRSVEERTQVEEAPEEILNEAYAFQDRYNSDDDA